MPSAANPPDYSSLMSSDGLGRVVALVNDKGGVGKSSLAVNVAGVAASLEYRTLLVAADAQYAETCGRDLGYWEDSDHGASLARAMRGEGEVQILHDVRPNLDVIADGAELESVLEYVYGRSYTREAPADEAFELLARVLHPIAGEYDLILIDGAPASKPLVRASLGAARWLLIPTKTDPGSIDALGGTAEEFERARTYGSNVQLAGVVMTGSSLPATKARAEAVNTIGELFGGEPPMFDAFTRFSESTAYRARAEFKLVHELTARFQKWNTASAKELAEEYYDITTQLLKIIKAGEENQNA